MLEFAPEWALLPKTAVDYTRPKDTKLDLMNKTGGRAGNGSPARAPFVCVG